MFAAVPLKYSLIANGLLLAALFAMGVAWRVDVTHRNGVLATLTADRDTVANNLDIAQRERFAAATSAAEWQTVALDLQVRLSTWINDAAVNAQRQADAVKRARAAQQESDAVLRSWLARYAAAAQREECRKLRETPLCAY